MKYYIIAGEASGDLHGSKLIRAIKSNDPTARIHAWGGDLMQAEGALLVKHFRELAFMGFIEVVLNVKTVINNLSFCKKDILAFQPDIVLFIDYPGFNLPVAKWAKSNGFKTAYYISPQIWAWKEKRIHTIKKVIDLMLVILPFEKEFYNKWKYKVEYVGHPLIEIIEEFKQSNDPAILKHSIQKDPAKKIVALLPGSRKQEIAAKLPIMLQATRNFDHVAFVVAQAPGIEDDYILRFTQGYKHVSILKNQTYSLLSVADAALVSSGTATLETALFDVPEVVCYKTSRISYQIANYFIKVKFISLVNLILNKKVVKELIQDDLQPEYIAEELKSLLDDNTKRELMQKEFVALKNILKSGGSASSNAAFHIQQLLKKS
jgi:lipid-A-disaccharide synthase